MVLLKKSEIIAGVIGHAVGDALGVPVEFWRREDVALHPVTEMQGYGSHNVPAGTWSDDTSMTIATMQSLVDCEGFDYDYIMANFFKWAASGDFTATGETFDIGLTVSDAIGNYYFAGISPLKCGCFEEHNNGNGSLMRILPVAFVCFDQGITGFDRYELVRKVSSLTHAHEVSTLGCLIYVNFIVRLLEGEGLVDAYVKTGLDDYSMFSNGARERYARILYEDISAQRADEIESTGYVVHSLEAALWCLLNTDGYEEAVVKAVNLGGDTDSIAAITGAAAGIYYGFKSIPERWLKKLQNLDYLLNICDEFAEAEIVCKPKTSVALR